MPQQASRGRHPPMAARRRNSSFTAQAAGRGLTDVSVRNMAARQPLSPTSLPFPPAHARCIRAVGSALHHGAGTGSCAGRPSRWLGPASTVPGQVHTLGIRAVVSELRQWCRDRFMRWASEPLARSCINGADSDLCFASDRSPGRGLFPSCPIVEFTRGPGSR